MNGRGFAFSKDTPWQAQMEARFPYRETPDQLACIREIKADMERPRPMDRLLCGDVGYGKTEVALRAAFKAVQDRQAGRLPRADDAAGAAALQHHARPLCGLPGAHGVPVALHAGRGAPGPSASSCAPGAST